MISVAAVKLRKMLEPVEPPLGSQAELARKLGVTPQAVNGWLNGGPPPRLENAAALEKLTGIPASEWTKPASEKRKPSQRSGGRSA